jgi:excisionase family DNA binding protein
VGAGAFIADRERTVVQGFDSGVFEQISESIGAAGRLSAELGHGFGAAASGHEIAYQRSNGERRAMWNGHASDEKLLTKGEVASLCRVELRTVDRWVASGKLRHYRTPSGRLLFRETDVLVMANRSRQQADETDL